jgi:hypothetical protein
MKTQEAFLNGKKIDVITEIDDDLIETAFIGSLDNLDLEDTTDLTEIIEDIGREFNEQ